MSGLSRSRSRGLLLAAAGLWVASLLLPAIDVAGGPLLTGGDVLLRGWTGWRNGVIAWYANPALVAAAILAWYRRDAAACVLAASAAIVALTSLAAERMARGTGLDVPDFSYRFGFYLWLAAQFVVLLAAAGAYVGTKAR